MGEWKAHKKVEGKMEFKEIVNEEDIRLLMQEYVGFHDSCIKEIKYVSGSYVNENRSMQPFNDVRRVEVLFQSQIAKKRDLELHFVKLKSMYLEPQDENYDGIIYEASLKQFEGLFYWCDWESFKKEDIDVTKGTWISSEKIMWRFREK